MKHTIILICAFMMCAGCFKFDVNPKVKAELKADVNTQVQAGLANLNNAMDFRFEKAKLDIKGEMQAGLINTSAKVGDLEQKIASFKGTQNVGMFSGGAIYLVAVCIFFMILSFIYAIIKMKSEAKWVQTFDAYAHAFEDMKSGSNKTIISGALKAVKPILKSQGLFTHVEKHLIDRGLNIKS